VEPVLGLGLLALLGFMVWINQNPRGPERPATHSSAAAAPVAASPPSIPEQLERLSSLHERGALSDDEFTAAKGELLHAAATPDQPRRRGNGTSARVRSA
jgi:hypothetical protein